MSTAAPEPAPAVDSASAQLDQLEAQAEQDITAALAGAATGAALLALLPTLLAIILAAATSALGVGIAIAQAAAGTRRPARLTEQPIPTAVDDDLGWLLADAAARLDAAARPLPRPPSPDTSTGSAGEEADDTDPVAAELDRTRARLVRLAVTKIHQAASAGTAMYARALGLGLTWVTLREGACPSCLRMDGARVGPGEVFPPPHGPGIPRRLWAGFQGLPPMHPNCRCRVRPTRAAPPPA